MAGDLEQLSSDDETDWKLDEKGFSIHLTKRNDIASDNERDEKKVSREGEEKEKKISRMELNTTKAGMEGLDRAKINQIIFEASKGSRFYENEQKKERQVQKRIRELKNKMAQITSEDRQKAKHEMDKLVEGFEITRDLSRTIVHVDMDAFYAAVEMRDDERLRTKPMAVGDTAMLCTSNYLARRFGVRAGMPGFIAKKLCPHLILVPANFKKYTKISEEIRDVFREYDKNFLPMSLDEAYLDLTEYIRKYRDGVLANENNTLRAAADENTTEAILCPNVEDRLKHDTPEGCGDHMVSATTSCITTEVAKKEKINDGEKQTVTKEKSPRCNDHYRRCGYPMVAATISSVTREADGHVPNGKGDEETGGEVRATTKEEQPQCSNPHTQGNDESGHQILNKDTGLSDVEVVVREMRRKIELKTQLTASAGIASNMFLAKVCSDINKPNGQYYLTPRKECIIEFIQKLPVRKAFGIGRVSEQILTSVLDINTCYDLYKKRDLMNLLFTPTACQSYLEISLGLGATSLSGDRERKSLSTETTFPEINKPDELYCKCKELCDELVKSLIKEQLLARKVSIKLKTVNFEVKTRVSTLCTPSNDITEVFNHAKKLLSHEIRACHPQLLRLRLMGVRASELYHTSEIGNESKQVTITSLLKQNDDCQPTLMISSDTPTMSEDNKMHSGDNMTASSAGKETFTCPVCGKDLSYKTSNALLQFNHHVDSCLNKQTITNILKEDTNTAPSTSRKRKRDSSNQKVNKRRTIDDFLTK